MGTGGRSGLAVLGRGRREVLRANCSKSLLVGQRCTKQGALEQLWLPGGTKQPEVRVGTSLARRLHGHTRLSSPPTPMGFLGWPVQVA